jgi:hypothetical protein
MFTQGSYHLLHYWCFIPPYAHPIGDRVMLQRIRNSGIQHAFTSTRSVYYTCGKEGIYIQLGKIPPVGTLPRPDYESMMARWESEGNPSLYSRRPMRKIRSLAALFTKR